MPEINTENLKIIDDNEIARAMKLTAGASEIKEILLKAEEMKGLDLEDCAKLLTIGDEALLRELFASARKVKMAIYGPRLVLFAPLYCSSYCANDCTYCAFHASNPEPRKKLSLNEVKEQTEFLVNMGHKRLLLEFGEHAAMNPIEYVIDVIKTIYEAKSGRGQIRRVNVNIAATTADNYRRLKEAGIGTYQLFQETYHRETYEKWHKGPKADYKRQLTAMFRAFAGGIDDLGIGVLFGLFDFRYEVLALVKYAQLMDKALGAGPHTISVPRVRPARTASVDEKYKVSDRDFLKLIAVLRLAVPYTGMIISTRESPEIRRQAFAIGISQASAASRTEPGGYKNENEPTVGAQFVINDHRSLGEVVQDICTLGFLPSFCTGCYRLGRTGDVFMELAKTGNIQNMCQPNALLTFKEYLLDYADQPTRQAGEKSIEHHLGDIKDIKIKEKLIENLRRLENGERDLYV